MWRDLKSGEVVADLINEIQVKLHDKNEMENCDRRIKSKIKKSMTQEEQDAIKDRELNKKSSYFQLEWNTRDSKSIRRLPLANICDNTHLNQGLK